jgi:rare lipoprotein A
MKFFLFIFFVLSIAFVKAQPQTGKASFYSDAFEGRPTASGEKYRADKLTAAHRTLPFGTVVKVTNMVNNEWVNVTINDRGPFVKGRVIDLSKAAMEKLNFFNQGTTEVKIEILADKGKIQPVMAGHGTDEEKEF